MTALYQTVGTSGHATSGLRSHQGWRRILLASTAALSLGMQDAAWAVCSDGSTFPTGGYVVGSAQVPVASNWSPDLFIEPVQSMFIPDNSVNEANDPARALTGGGHNWVFDLGLSLCKAADVGPGGARATGWSVPFTANAGDCDVLPIIKGGVIVGLGDTPYQGDAVTPTCDPTLLSTANAPNPANTYFNQLGCSIYHGVRTDAQHATTFMFVTGIRSGLFVIPLDNVANPVPGGEAGKILGEPGYYAAIPEGQRLTNAAVSRDGRFVVATSNKKLQPVFACLNPLGDPGDPAKPINPGFSVPQASAVACMQVGNNNLAADLTIAFGPDSQPYFGGQRLGNAQNAAVNSFNAVPGGSAKSAWPNCLWQTNGSTSLADAFLHHRAGGCGNAAANAVVAAPLPTPVEALISHGTYLYAGPTGGPIVQYKVAVDPTSGLSSYASRTYFTPAVSSFDGVANVTGLGVADDLGSLMVFDAPFSVGMSPGFWTKLPLCEDMN